MDQTGLNKTLQSNAAAYNPDTTADQAAYAKLRAWETAGAPKDTAQIAAPPMRKKAGPRLPGATKRGR